MTALRSVRAGLAATAALAVLAASSAWAAAEEPGGTIISGPRTKALFARVHRAYRPVPAVEMVVVAGKSTFRTPRRFVLVLRSGVVVAEEFARSGRGGVTLVARRSHPTYARAAGAKCWSRLPASDPRTLEDVGIPFPYLRETIKALQPKATAFGWTVETANREEFWFLAVAPKPAHRPAARHGYTQRFITYAIDAKSHQFRSILVQQPENRPLKFWPVATLAVRALVKAPQLPTPAPVC